LNGDGTDDFEITVNQINSSFTSYKQANIRAIFSTNQWMAGTRNKAISYVKALSNGSVISSSAANWSNNRGSFGLTSSGNIADESFIGKRLGF